MKLKLSETTFSLDASSQDARLATIPGFGWQPTPRAWEFDLHPGIVALAMAALGAEVEFDEYLRQQAENWRRLLRDRSGPVLEAATLGNTYHLEHGEDELAWVTLVPTRRVVEGGSTFMRHPAIAELLGIVFGSTIRNEATTIRVRMTDQVAFPAAQNRPAAANDPANPSLSVHAHYPSASPDNETLDPADLADAFERLLDQDTAKGLLAAAVALTELPIEIDAAERLQSKFLTATGYRKESGWAGWCGYLLASVVDGDHEWLGSYRSKPISGELSRIAAALSLAATLYRNGRSEGLASAWRPFLLTLDPQERVELLLMLPNVADWSDTYPGLVRLIWDLFEDAPTKTSKCLLDLADLAWHESTIASRAIRCWLDEDFEEDDANPDDVRTFLERAVDTLAKNRDENGFRSVFEAYAAVLLSEADYEGLEALAGKYFARLPIQATLLIAYMKCLQEGAVIASEFLLDRYEKSHPNEFSRHLLIEEARLYAGTNPELQRRCAQVFSPAIIPLVEGRILVVGGDGPLRSRCINSLHEQHPRVQIDWLLPHECLDRARVAGLVQGCERVALYTWQISHAASTNVKTAARQSGALISEPQFPGAASLVATIISLLSKN